MAEKIYGVIDCARARTMYPLVEELGPKARCLFAGPLAAELRRVSPHLVDLSGGSRLRQQWRLRGKGQSWGILMSSPAELGIVARHLRHFLLAKLPDKRIVLFRFYDPRVFRVYLPTCSAEDLDKWFSKSVDAFYAETADGEAYAEYQRVNGKLTRSSKANII